MELFSGCDELQFVHEIMDIFYPETQEGFDRLAFEINARCHLLVKLHYYPEDDIIKIIVDGGTRKYRTFFKNENLGSTFFRIKDILTAFACGFGYDC